MRVFITGATGYVGHAVALAAKKRGHDVVGLARSEAARERLLRANLHPVMGDLTTPEVLHEMVRDADAVIYCAFAQGPDAAEIEAAALSVMLAAIGKDHKAFIYTSGVWVYGWRGDAVVDEGAPLSPTPLVAWRPDHEQRVLAAATRENVRTMVIRPATVYGNGGGIIGGMIAEAGANGGVVKIVGDGANRWSTVRVDALAELYVLALERASGGSIYNATHGAPVRYADIARAASRAGGGDGAIDHLDLDYARSFMGPFADALALDLQVSAQKAARELGWNPHRPTVLDELSSTTVV
ncbi:MAG: NAD-dependent epimerase/dehydratase family protein [Candidatus Velthaea sp.]|jgi:nucleoside-diphosphate-sugar epimerase